MCRGKASGGRRCPGCIGPEALEAHNRRRRENRAIRQHAADFAAQRGMPADQVAELRKLPPGKIKELLLGQGLDPAIFIDGVPDQLKLEAGAAGGAAVAAGGLAGGQAHGGAGGPARGGAGGSARGGAGGVAAPAVVRRDAGAGRLGAAAGPREVSQPRQGAGDLPRGGPVADWHAEEWCSADLRGQIHRVLGVQGDHRDEASLLAGEVTHSKKVGGGTNETWRVELDNGMVGFHKPFSGVADGIASSFGHSGAEQPVHEVVAWRLAKELGEPWSHMVPPCVLKKVGGRLGSFALERPGRPMVITPWHVPEWRSAALFDALIGQQDRHPGNYLVAGDRLALIDHGYSFATPGDRENWSWFVNQRSLEDRSLTGAECQALGSLLGSKDRLGLAGLLASDREDFMVDRARRMLETGEILLPGDY